MTAPALTAQPAFHFLHDPRKPESQDLAMSLMGAFGQVPADDAEIIVTVGGDGLLLEGLRLAQGKRVYGLTPQTSNSRGFWTDHSVATPDDLLRCVAQSHQVELLPLQADIHFMNGNMISKLAFNDVAIERATGQSALLNLSVHFAKQAMGDPVRIMGDGFVFSTALGSTGTCRSYGGPAIDITNNVIIMVGKGIFEPRGISPVVTNAARTEFLVNFASVASKRPVRIDYDGLSIGQDSDGSLISGLRIAAAPKECAAHLLLTTEPGQRALMAMVP